MVIQTILSYYDELTFGSFSNTLLITGHAFVALQLGTSFYFRKLTISQAFPILLAPVKHFKVAATIHYQLN